MRSYGQYCSLARALDVIGDRWTLLIVRELWLRPCRYNDLSDSLPGIATNLLTDRLRKLEAAGVVDRPAPGGLYALTPRGADLAPVLRDLIRWGSPLMGEAQGDDVFNANWLGIAVTAVFEGVEVAETFTFAMAVDGQDERVVFTADPGSGVQVTPSQNETQATLSGTAEALIAAITGRGDFDSLQASGSMLAIGRLRDLLAVATSVRS